MGEAAEAALEYMERYHSFEDVYSPSYHRKRNRNYMSNNNATTVFVSGKLYWPKIVGERGLHDNYNGDGRQWAYELVPDDMIVTGKQIP